MRVFVYFNLHKKCLSIRAMEGPSKGRVIGHASAVTLIGCTLKVSEAGRQRVLRERKKNVHAGVQGWLATTDDHQATMPIIGSGVPVKYNPYKYKSFVHVVNETPVHSAKWCAITVINQRAAIFVNT